MQALVDLDTCLYISLWNGKGDYLSSVENLDSYLLWVLETFPESPRFFLSGKNNFRYNICKDYKANRKDKPKPRYFSDLREYAKHFWHAEEVDGMEADDAIGLAQTENTVVISVDKDLNQVIGAHADPKTMKVYDISEQEAAYHFYKQLITGDKTDNVTGVGVWGWGEKSTKPAKLLDGLTKPQMQKAVQDLYKEHLGDDWFSRYDTAARLLFIKRENVTKEYYDFY